MNVILNLSSLSVPFSVSRHLYSSPPLLCIRPHINARYEEIKDDPDLTDEQLSAVWDLNYEERNDSHIKDVFAGQLQSTVTCKQCKHRSVCFDPFWDLSIPIPKSR